MEKSWNCVFEFLWEPCKQGIGKEKVYSAVGISRYMYLPVYKSSLFQYQSHPKFFNKVCLVFITSPYMYLQFMDTVNVLKFQTLFLFSSRINCWLSGILVTKANREDPDQTASFGMGVHCLFMRF